MPTSSLTAVSPLLHNGSCGEDCTDGAQHTHAPSSSAEDRCMTRRQQPIQPEPRGAPGGRELDASRLGDVAGHRIVRRLAVGTRATLLLAHASGRGDGEGPSPRVLKIFGASASAASIDVELAALSDVGIPHVVRLLDVASIDDGAAPCFVLERLPGPSLSTYLGQTSSLSPGEAVTILAPLCSALHALHRAGVTHGGIHLRRIVFDHRGSPTLTGFGRGMLRQSPTALHSAAWPGAPVPTSDSPYSTEEAWREAVVADQRGLLDVVDEVLSRIDAERMPASFPLERLGRAITEGPSREFLPELERALFGIAPAEVVSIAPTPTVALAAADRAAKTEYDWSSSTPAAAPAQTENRLVAALRILGVSSAGLEFASSVIELRSRFLKRQRPPAATPSAEEHLDAGGTRIRRRRKPLLVAASCAVVAATALLLVLPSPPDGARAGAENTSTTRYSTTDPSSDVAAPPAPAPAEPLPTKDDPVSALQTLARMNEGCAAAAEPEGCLATVFQEDFMDSRSTDEPFAIIEAGDAVLTGSWGGSALVAARLNGQPASFLLLKGEAGWRIRDVFKSD